MIASAQSVRLPAVAGTFYPDSPDQCRQEAWAYLKQAPQHDSATGRVFGALLPHAGWVCSGAVAAEGMAHVARFAKCDLVVVFGAVHTHSPCEIGALDSHSTWSMPSGDVILPDDLQRQLLSQRDFFCIEPRLHAREHSIEVQLPFIQSAFAGIPILPIEVPPTDRAEAVGRQAAIVLRELGRSPVFFASSDLTHYGPNYGFMPAGTGPKALEWARENDLRFLNLVANLESGKVVTESSRHQNACGAGAVAAMLAACRELGATKGQLLRHTNSYEVLSKITSQRPDTAVGYAAVAVG